MGQYSVSIQAKIKKDNEFGEKDNDKDCAWLSNQIKSVLYKFDSKRDTFYSLVEARSMLSPGNKRKARKIFMILFTATWMFLNILVESLGMMTD